MLGRVICSRIAREIALLVAILLEIGLVPAAARKTKRRGCHLTGYFRLFANRTEPWIRVRKLLQTVKLVATSAANVGINGHEGYFEALHGAIQAAKYGGCEADFKWLCR